MEYSKENIVSRKEYLNSKKKHRVFFRILKYFLIIVVAVSLSIYLYNQLNIYNNVTKLTNKVVEETALLNTNKLYYVQQAYTKQKNTNVYVYKMMDQSRTMIPNTENINNITVTEEYLIGIKDGDLLKINLTTNEVYSYSLKNIKSYVTTNEFIYYYSNQKENIGLYRIDLVKNEIKKLIEKELVSFDINENYIYTIEKNNKEKVIAKYDLSGNLVKIYENIKKVKELKCFNGNLYFTSENSKLYLLDEDASKSVLIIDSPISTIKDVSIVNNKVFYINKERILCELNNNEISEITKKEVDLIKTYDNSIFYIEKGDIGVYKYNIQKNQIEKITSIGRLIEFIYTKI